MKLWPILTTSALWDWILNPQRNPLLQNPAPLRSLQPLPPATSNLTPATIPPTAAIVTSISQHSQPWNNTSSTYCKQHTEVVFPVGKLRCKWVKRASIKHVTLWSTSLLSAVSERGGESTDHGDAVLLHGDCVISRMELQHRDLVLGKECNNYVGPKVRRSTQAMPFVPYTRRLLQTHP